MWTTKDMPDQTGKTIIVTGANTGIGYETAKALHLAGADVILACRDLKKGDEAAGRIKTDNSAGTIKVMQLDLQQLPSVAEFAEQFLSSHQQLDVLINNAGVMIPPLSRTPEGFELQFGINFIGHYALTGHLYHLLKETPNARIVTVSSMAYLNGVIDFDNLKAEKDYDAMREYRQSKLADIMFTLELQRRIVAKGDNVLSIAAQPGANNTELSRYMSKADYEAAVARIGALMEPWQGALPSLYAATSPDAVGGVLYSPHEGGYFGYPVRDTLKAHALDEATAARLYQLGEEVTGIQFP